MTPESPSYADRKFPCPNCSREMVLTNEEYSQHSSSCPYCGTSGATSDKPTTSANTKTPRRREKPYRALDDSVFRTIAPKAALKHDINNTIAEIIGEVTKEAWHGMRRLFSKRKTKNK